MGQEILYCVACQTQLRGADFDKRRAVRADGKGYCLKCAQAAFSPERLAQLLDPGGAPSSTRLSGYTPKPTRRVLPAASSSTRVLAIGGAAALVLIGVMIAILSGGGPPPPPPSPPPVAAPPPVKEVRREKEATLKPLPEVTGLDAELQRLLPKEEFGQALRLIESARTLSPQAEWTRMVNQRSDDVHGRAEKLLKDLKAKAVEAKLAGNLEEPLRIKERLSKWEYGRAIPELDAALADAVIPVTYKVLLSQDFNSGRGAFEGGELVEGALAVPPKGVGLPSPFNSPIQPTSAIRFRVKPPPGCKQIQVILWSNTLKNNGWVHLDLKPGEWQQVEFKASEFRVNWNRDGASLAGHTGNSLNIHYSGTPPDARVLIDDFEIRE